MAESAVTDIRDLALSGADASAAGRFDTIVNDIYYYRLGVQDRLDALLEDYPDFALAHVLKGYSLITEGTLDAHPKAEAHLKRAEECDANERERLHQAALRAWLEQDGNKRALAWEQILVDWPMDLLAFRQHTGTLFWSGDKRHQAGVCTIAAAHWSPGMPGYGHFLSALSFAMAEVSRYGLAERAARDAMELEPQDLWALHGLAHVLEMQGRSAEGIATLNEAAKFLNDYNLFRGHLWWHLALFNFAHGRFDEALDLFDREIYPKPSGFYLDIQNGASLLARLEFQGVDVGTDRWARLAEGSMPNATQCTIWFTAMHHAMALTRAGKDDDLAATLSYLKSSGAKLDQAAIASQLSQAAVDYYQGRERETLVRMLTLRQRDGILGASYAQQDLYDQIMVMAAFKTGDWPRVRQLLSARLATRIWNPSTWNAFVARAPEMAKIEDENALRKALRWS
jgi:tetratricopeptide (TPR) repeat protein